MYDMVYVFFYICFSTIADIWSEDRLIPAVAAPPLEVLAVPTPPLEVPAVPAPPLEVPAVSAPPPEVPAVSAPPLEVPAALLLFLKCSFQLLNTSGESI